MGLPNIPIGAGKFSIGASDLGLTFGGGSISIEESATDIKADQYGTQVLDQVITGTKATVTVNITEIGALAVMPLVFPAGSIAGTLFAIKPNVGTSRLGLAAALTIELYSDETTPEAGNTPNKWVFWKACSDGKFQYEYDDWGKQKSCEISFTCYPDITSHSGDLGYRGKV